VRICVALRSSLPVWWFVSVNVAGVGVGRGTIGGPSVNFEPWFQYSESLDSDFTLRFFSTCPNYIDHIKNNETSYDVQTAIWANKVRSCSRSFTVRELSLSLSVSLVLWLFFCGPCGSILKEATGTSGISMRSCVHSA
jgi:hypothetical protein